MVTKVETTIKITTQSNSWMKDKYESFWLYPESHPYRLAQHIALRGVFMGTGFGLLGGTGYALLKKRGTATPLLPWIGRVTFRGGAGTGALLALIAAERLWNLPEVGVADRAYRISYNWGQTKWDYIACAGGVIGGVMLRSACGGLLPAAAVGVGLGNFAYLASVAV